MISWLVNHWVVILAVGIVAFLYFFVFSICNIASIADERAEYDIWIMKKQASERDGVVDPPDIGGI